jgi:hypothetical protein
MIKRIITLAALLVMLAVPMSFVVQWLDYADYTKRERAASWALDLCGLNENGFAVEANGKVNCYNKRGKFLRGVEK